MSEAFLMRVMRYRTTAGDPTCANDFKAGNVCVFLQTYKFGCRDTCFFLPDDQRHKPVLERGVSFAGVKGEGYLIPFDGCPVWKEDRSWQTTKK